jgi:hypothetical protein
MAAPRRKSAAAPLISPRLVAGYQFIVHGGINYQERIRGEDARKLRVLFAQERLFLEA